LSFEALSLSIESFSRSSSYSPHTTLVILSESTQVQKTLLQFHIFCNILHLLLLSQALSSFAVSFSIIRITTTRHIQPTRQSSIQDIFSVINRSSTRKILSPTTTDRHQDSPQQNSDDATRRDATRHDTTRHVLRRLKKQNKNKTNTTTRLAPRHHNSSTTSKQNIPQLLIRKYE